MQQTTGAARNEGFDTKALRVLVVPGSARAGSFNFKLAQLAAALLREQAAEASVIDLRALALPIYDGDLEASLGVPEGAHTLVRELAGHDAVLVVSPEYNAFPTPLFINAFDWASRLAQAKPALQGKPTALLGASPGALGGLRSLFALRQFMALNLGMLVLPQQLALSHAHEAFGADGALLDAGRTAALQGVLAALLQATAALGTRAVA